MAISTCFVCERPFGEGHAPAETWAHGDHTVCVCRSCVENPPGGPHVSLDALPSELRQPLMFHLELLSLRAQSRKYRSTARSARMLSESIRDRMAWVRHTHRRRNGDESSREPPK